MEKVQWKVEGMTCANCALTIHKYLEKEGMKEVRVNALGGDVSFEMNGTHTRNELVKGIKGLGYHVAGELASAREKRPILSTTLEKFLFCLPLTIAMMLPMVPGLRFHFLMMPEVQLALCLPVYLVGMSFFGRSALGSLRNGLPNMNVLVSLGATASFVYSLYGTFVGQAEHYMFYETTAAIITLVFLGNYLEDASLRSTQKALDGLAKSQTVMANMLAYDNEHQEHVFPVENTQLKPGDLVLIKTGEQVPADCKILWGTAYADEAILTGESTPVFKNPKDKLIGGSILHEGTVKAQITAVGNDTVLSGIINLVKQAQGDKPPVQLLADKISAIFVPVVIGIAIITWGVNWFVLGSFTDALMRSIAVLVIACPCAMGLATPAAIAVGLGRSARSGILFRNGTSLELFKNIKQVVFDKTGTLTTGEFGIAAYQILSQSSEEEFRLMVYSLEKYSNHPVARGISKAWKSKSDIRWQKIEELKGLGMKAIDKEGKEFCIGSYKLAEKLTHDDSHSVYVVSGNQLLGWLDVKDEARAEARDVVQYLKARNIKTILLSGDRQAKCDQLAMDLGIDEVFAGQTPEQKLRIIEKLTSEAPTVMVGDGVNDAPALAKATVGVSMSEASQVAMQTAQVVLMGRGLNNLPMALGLGRHTYLTIRQNLFWAFFYNIIAIPVAALGLLTPVFGALVMAFSDVVLAINSVRLFVKKVL